MLVSSSFSDKDKKIQDDISDYINFKLFINEIITHNIIIIKNNLE